MSSQPSMTSPSPHPSDQNDYNEQKEETSVVSVKSLPVGQVPLTTFADETEAQFQATISMVEPGSKGNYSDHWAELFLRKSRHAENS
jgi:hypothetical protein